MTYFSVLAVTPTTEDWIPDYIEPANKLVAKHGGKCIDRTSNHQRLEDKGENSSLRIIIKWPSKEDALSFMQNPEYIPHLNARTKGSVSHHYLIEAKDNLDVRFVVNTIAPYLLTKLLFPFLAESSRVVNLSSAAQAPINMEALKGKVRLGDMKAYAQSKLAISIWTSFFAKKLANKKNAIFISVNPGSLLASKMVKEGFGVPGKDINIGARILEKLATSAEFADANGKYFDNDIGQFTSLHPDVLNKQKSEALITTIEEIIKLD